MRTALIALLSYQSNCSNSNNIPLGDEYTGSGLSSDEINFLESVKLGTGDRENLFEVQKALSKISNIDVQHPRTGCTALLYSIDNYKSPIVAKFLIKHGASVNKIPPCRESPLGGAAYAQNYSLVKFLLDSGSKDVNSQDSLGTPLNFASRVPNLRLIRLLIKNGADVNLPDKVNDTSVITQNDTPLTVITRNIDQDFSYSESNTIEAMKFLIHKGANLNHVNQVGMTPLMYSASYGSYDITKLLIDEGANINAETGYGTPLMLSGSYDITKLLINKGADINAKNYFGCSVLFKVVSVKYGFDKEEYQSSLNWQYKTAKLLISKGADVNAKNEDGYSVLMAAIWPGKTSTKIVKLLIDHGADVNAKSKNGLTPLIKAAKENQSEVIHLLLEKGAKNISHTD
ncbi:ankyrin repeat domain-containing protein [Leptospira adleri]|nr:ankyrin repeat domain-containing protein [Leptospira adleri]